MKINLVPDWRNSWKWFSQQAFVMAGTLQTTMLLLTPEQLESLNVSGYGGKLILAIVILGFVGRMVDQK